METLTPPGRLRVADGVKVTLTREGHNTLEIVGPTEVELLRNGDWIPLAAQHGTKQGRGEKAPRLVLPPIMLAERGTEYEYVLLPSGVIAVYVLKGTVEITSLGQDQPSHTLQPGEMWRFDPVTQREKILRGMEARQERGILVTRLTTEGGETATLEQREQMQVLRATDSLEALTRSSAWSTRSGAPLDVLRGDVQVLLNRQITSETPAVVSANALLFSRLAPNTREASEVLLRAWLACRHVSPLASELEAALRSVGLPEEVRSLEAVQRQVASP